MCVCVCVCGRAGGGVGLRHLGPTTKVLPLDPSRAHTTAHLGTIEIWIDGPLAQIYSNIPVPQ